MAVSINLVEPTFFQSAKISPEPPKTPIFCYQWGTYNMIYWAGFA